MKHFGIAWILFGCALVFAQDSAGHKSAAIAGPMIWNTTIEGFAVNGGEKPAVRSIFTPDRAIRVTHIEAFDEQGPRLNVSGITTPFTPCSPQPSLTITDGTSTYTLPISSEFLPNSAATHTYSERLGLAFPAGSSIRLMIVPPEIKQRAVCMAKPLHVLVQYSSQSD
jgi:hypothetical protein